jgi:hypothetical protein
MIADFSGCKRTPELRSARQTRASAATLVCGNPSSFARLDSRGRLSLRGWGYFVGEVFVASAGGIAISFAGGTPLACRIAQCHSSSGLR